MQIWVGVFGLVAALASFRSGWKATALPSAASVVPSPSESKASDLLSLDQDARPAGYDALS